MCRIRKAKLSDLDALAVLWKGLMKHHRSLAKGMGARRDLVELAQHSERTWRQWAAKNIRSANGLVLVAEDRGRIVGYSLNIIKTNVKVFKVKRFGYLSDLFIIRPYRGRGLGTAFLKEALAWFRKKRMRHASIAYRACNREAGQAYRSWGFRENHVELVRKL